MISKKCREYTEKRPPLLSPGPYLYVKKEAMRRSLVFERVKSVVLAFQAKRQQPTMPDIKYEIFHKFKPIFDTIVKWKYMIYITTGSPLKFL